MTKIIQNGHYADAFHAHITTALAAAGVVLATLTAVALMRTDLSPLANSNSQPTAVSAMKIQHLRPGHSPYRVGRKFERGAPGLFP